MTMKRTGRSLALFAMFMLAASAALAGRGGVPGPGEGGGGGGSLDPVEVPAGYCDYVATQICSSDGCDELRCGKIKLGDHVFLEATVERTLEDGTVIVDCADQYIATKNSTNNQQSACSVVFSMFGASGDMITARVKDLGTTYIAQPSDGGGDGTIIN